MTSLTFGSVALVSNAGTTNLTTSLTLKHGSNPYPNSNSLTIILSLTPTLSMC